MATLIFSSDFDLEALCLKIFMTLNAFQKVLGLLKTGHQYEFLSLNNFLQFSSPNSNLVLNPQNTIWPSDPHRRTVPNKGSASPPALLHVSREPRSEVLKSYTLIGARGDLSCQPYFDHRADILFLRDEKSNILPWSFFEHSTLRYRVKVEPFWNLQLGSNVSRATTVSLPAKVRPNCTSRVVQRSHHTRLGC
jgi:hypothetical protein